MSLSETFSKDLNLPQKQAVEASEGPLLILAGAGSGKTRVLTYRIAQLIATGKAAPEQILAVTFTNKAAREMEERTLRLLEKIGVPVMDRMWISTFHSTCARILRDEIHLLDYQPYFGIYDDSDQRSLLKKVLRALNIDEKVHSPKVFQARINEAKQLGLTPDEVAKKSGFLMDEMSLSVYHTYELEMKKANALDFGDLLLKTYELFRMYPDILGKYQDRFRFILIDEYQDTNHIQYLLVKMLADKHRNLCVVGDEDQSIYSWRGADITNILSFEKDFPECVVVKLEENYRSSQTIVAAASEVIKNNTQRKNKTLFTSNPAGEKIVVREEKNEYDEAQFIVQQMEALIKSDKREPSGFAIFYRTNAQSRVLEDQLRSHKMNYKIVGGVKFYERLEIKDMLAYLKVIMNPADEVAMKRIINTPARGIGKSTVDKIELVSIDQSLSFFDSILYVAEQRLVHSGATKKLRDFHRLIEQMRTAAPEMSPSEIYLGVLDATEYARRLKEENTPESLARIDNLEELDNAIRHFEQERGDEGTLQNFLEEMALVSDADQIDNDPNSVTMMTLHISKGLEYPVVFITGMEEGLFPSARSFDSADTDGIEEERRLAYVGMTRARERLFLTYARSRRVWGQEQSHTPSRFLDEIPENYVKKETSMHRPKFMDSFSGATASTARPHYPSSPKRSPSSNYDAYDAIPNYEDFGDESSFESQSSSEYQKGMRVRHPTFGAGQIFEVEGRGSSQKVSVLFENKTLKKFITKYARLEVI
jgi:DNA helicase-2/ATP-dependent DNA helicase PcrA